VDDWLNLQRSTQHDHVDAHLLPRRQGQGANCWEWDQEKIDVTGKIDNARDHAEGGINASGRRALRAIESSEIGRGIGGGCWAAGNGSNDGRCREKEASDNDSDVCTILQPAYRTKGRQYQAEERELE
jgi:hypothetical protein